MVKRGQIRYTTTVSEEVIGRFKYLFPRKKDQREIVESLLTLFVAQFNDKAEHGNQKP